MALEWMKVRPDICDRTEIFRMAIALGVSEETVAGHLMRVWGHAHANLTTNDTGLPKAVIDRIGRLPGLVDAMISVGWAEEICGIVHLVGWVEWTGVDKAKEKAESDRDRKRAYREQKRAESQRQSEDGAEMSDGCPKDVPRTSSGRRADVQQTAQGRLDKTRLTSSKDDVSSVSRGREHTSSSSTPSPDDVLEYLGKVNGSQGVMVVQSDLETLGQKYLADRMASGWVTRHGIPISDWISDLRGYAIAWTQNNKAAPQAAKVAYSRNTGTANDPELKKPLPVYTPEQLADFERQKWEILGKPQPTTKQP